MTNDGKAYEAFVGQLQQALLDVEKIATQRTIKVERNKVIKDKNGCNREFDLYWEYELGGFLYKTIIECKDYKSAITVEKIDGLLGKIGDIPGLRGIFATKTGYQSGARTKAEAHEIELLVVREQNDSDWVDENGTPYLREIHLNMRFGIPPSITKFEPLLDGDWAEENTDYKIGDSMTVMGMNNEIFIADHANQTRMSLHEIESNLIANDGREFGDFTETIEYKDAYLECHESKFKIKGYRISYHLSPPIDNTSIIDFSAELMGVIEYLNRGVKRSIFKSGMTRDEPLLNTK